MQLSEEIVSCDSPVARLYEQHAPALFAFLRQKTAAREDAIVATVPFISRSTPITPPMGIYSGPNCPG